MMIPEKGFITPETPLSIKQGTTIHVLDDIKEGEASIITITVTGDLFLRKYDNKYVEE